MNSIKIEVRDCFWNKEVFLVSDEQNSYVIHHEKGNFKETEEIDKKCISKSDFEKIVNTFSEINFTEITKEHGNLLGLDGWTLICSLENGTSKSSVEIWCPEKSPSTPETKKLIEACELVCPVMEIEREEP